MRLGMGKPRKTVAACEVRDCTVFTVRRTGFLLYGEAKAGADNTTMNAKYLMTLMSGLATM
jgi:hypothetical protein